jgi:hypothetical protein
MAKGEIMKDVELKKIRTVAALVERPRVVRVEWEDGEVNDIDLSEIVTGYASFEPVRDPERFSRVRVGEWGWSIDFGDDIEVMNTTLWRLAREQSGEAMPVGAFRNWRSAHGLSLARTAQVLGISRRMVAYYDSGEKIIPKYIRLACKGAESELPASARG